MVREARGLQKEREKKEEVKMVKGRMSDQVKTGDGDDEMDSDLQLFGLEWTMNKDGMDWIN